jgi:hypothetical protein
MNGTPATRLIGLHVAAVATIGIVAASVLSNSNGSASSDVADYGSSVTAQSVSHQHNGGHQ